MASVIDICNIALSRLGDEANISNIDPPEGGDHAEQCARWYPLSRDKALAAFPWTFATRTVALAPLATKPIGHDYAFKIPNGCLKVIDAFDPTLVSVPKYDRSVYDYAQKASDFEWSIELVDGTRCVVTDAETVAIRYVMQQTDTTMYPPSFTDALCWLLASDLAGPCHTGATGIQLAEKCYQAYQTALEFAKQEDCRQQNMIFEVRPRMQGTAP